MEKAPYLIWTPTPDWFYDLLKGLQKVENRKEAEARKGLLRYKLDQYERRRNGIPLYHEEPESEIRPVIPNGYHSV